MNKQPNVVIVLSRCHETKQTFGIRFEEKKHRQWFGNWAFAIKERSANREGYDKTKITGSIELDTTYPSCTYCENSSIFLCSSCDKVGCWDSHRDAVTCPWCNTTTKLGGQIKSLHAGTDR